LSKPFRGSTLLAGIVSCSSVSIASPGLVRAGENEIIRLHDTRQKIETPGVLPEGFAHVLVPSSEKEKEMKIAAITDDGKTISQHFGRAQYYLVATIENGEIIDRELREKLGHAQFASDPHAADVPGQPHGMDPASQDRHILMAQAILDCKALLCRGMGMGAYESMKVAGIQPVVTDIASIDEAVMAYVEGKIVDRVDRLH
jgi:predicted Fe-Mo cluster-binding NifX family protein